MTPGKNHVNAISTEIFKYVRIHPNFASRPVWREKMFLCCFFPKSRKTWQTGLKFSFIPPPPPPPHTHTHTHTHAAPSIAPFLLKNAEFGYTRYGKRELQAYLSSLFFLLSGKTTQEHLFTSRRSACEVWVDSDIFSRNGGCVLLARSHSIICDSAASLLCDCVAVWVALIGRFQTSRGMPMVGPGCGVAIEMETSFAAHDIPERSAELRDGQTIHYRI